MGRRLNVSTPTVINTELMPLDELFYIEANGQLEQWFYDNTAQYAPNRALTPLTLTPVISAFDADSKQRYTPSFYTVKWYEKAYNSTTGDYVETEITNIVDDQSAEYVKSGNNLIVKKNVSYAGICFSSLPVIYCYLVIILKVSMIFIFSFFLLLPLFTCMVKV